MFTYCKQREQGVATVPERNIYKALDRQSEIRNHIHYLMSEDYSSWHNTTVRGFILAHLYFTNSLVFFTILLTSILTVSEKIKFCVSFKLIFLIHSD